MNRDTEAQIMPQVPLACVLGAPIAHSRSPMIHEAGLRALRLSGHYLSFETNVDQLETAFTSLSSLGFRGANLTAPLKVAARALLDIEDDDVRHIGAVNTVVFDHGQRIGHNTDAAGLVTALTDVCGLELAGAKVLILGAGGAARAATWAMIQARVNEVLVMSRRLESATSLCAWFNQNATPIPSADNLRVDLVINATTAGMRGTTSEAEVPIDLTALGSIGCVYDMVYDPAATPLLKVANSLAVPAFNGLSMLVAQARLAFGYFFGAMPELDRLMEALAPRP
jgi:shikimate dehydrogenase